MSWVAVAVAGAGMISGYTSQKSANKAANKSQSYEELRQTHPWEPTAHPLNLLIGTSGDYYSKILENYFPREAAARAGTAPPPAPAQGGGSGFSGGPGGGAGAGVSGSPGPPDFSQGTTNPRDVLRLLTRPMEGPEVDALRGYSSRVMDPGYRGNVYESMLGNQLSSSRGLGAGYEALEGMANERAWEQPPPQFYGAGQGGLLDSYRAAGDRQNLLKGTLPTRKYLNRELPTRKYMAENARRPER